MSFRLRHDKSYVIARFDSHDFLLMQNNFRFRKQHKFILLTNEKMWFLTHRFEHVGLESSTRS